MFPSLGLLHSCALSQGAWQGQSLKPWDSNAYQVKCCSILYHGEQLWVQVPHEDKLTCIFSSVLINRATQQIRGNGLGSPIWFELYPFAVPRIIFIRISQVRGLRGPTSPWSHCSKFPLFTYSYTSILQQIETRIGHHQHICWRYHV